MHDLYQQQILERSSHPLFAGELEGATHTAEGANLSCGDEIRWQAVIEDGKVTKLRHTCRACAICTASADLLAEQFQGTSTDEITRWTPEKVTELLGIQFSPARLKCALLPFETLKLMDKTP